MPEGDTVWNTARVLERGLVGKTLVRGEFRVPRLAGADVGGWHVAESTDGSSTGFDGRTTGGTAGSGVSAGGRSGESAVATAVPSSATSASSSSARAQRRRSSRTMPTSRWASAIPASRSSASP